MNNTPPITTFLAPKIDEFAPLFPGYGVHELIIPPAYCDRRVSR